MKKVLFSLGGAVLLVVLLTAPALAGVFWQSGLRCGPLGVKPFVTILSPSGNLHIRATEFNTLFADTPFTCEITCSESGGSNSQPCGRTDATGRLKAQLIKGFATEAALGVDVCIGLEFKMTPNFPFFPAICEEGFRAGFEAP